MPTYMLTSPDGKKYRVTGEGTGEEALAALQSQLGMSREQPKQHESIGRTALEQGLQGASFGFADEVTDRLGAGIASLATGEKYGDLLKEARGNTEQRFARQFEQNPITSIGANIGGALLTGGAGATTKAGTMLGNSLRTGNTAARIAKGALAGAASGGLYGAGAAADGRRLEGAGQGAALGGLVGGAIPAVGTGLRAAKRAATPVVDDAIKDVAKLARKYDIPLSLDQISNSGALASLQKNSQDLIGSGQAKFRDRQMKAFNRALMKTVGIEADSITPEVMDKAFSKVGGEFDSLTANKNFPIGGQFIDDIASRVDDVASAYGDDAAKVFEREALKVINDFGGGDTISGNLISRQRARVNALARKATDKNIKGALQDLENAIIDGITGGDEAAQSALSQAKQRYKNLIAIEPLAAKAKGGQINPTQLNSRIARIYGRAHTTGKAGDIGELARVGHELMPVKGGSDTVSRANMIATAVGLANPHTTVPTAALLGGNRAMQAGINRNQALIDKVINRSSLPALRPASAVGAIPAGAAAGAVSAPREGITQQITPQSFQTIEQQPLFDKAFQHVLDVEGGYVADDAGKGETNMGVNTTANPDVDIKNLTKPEARNIYKKRYWDAIGAEKMPPALAMVAFDGAVNQGVGKTKELLKKSGGDPMTLLKLREQHYANLIRMNPKKFAKYGNGWMGRLKKLEQMIMEG